MVAEMTRAVLCWLLILYCTPAWGQSPIYPAFPQPPAPWAYSPYTPMYRSPIVFPGFPFYGYRPYGFGYGFGASPWGNLNWLPPNPPSPYYVTPSGKDYLEQARRRELATYTQLKLQHYLQK